MTLSKEYVYARERILKSGIGFKNISKDEIMMTCVNYNGIISKENYEAVLSAINDVYKRYERVQKCV